MVGTFSFQWLKKQNSYLVIYINVNEMDDITRMRIRFVVFDDNDQSNEPELYYSI